MDDLPRVRPVLTPAQERDQAILDAAAARRAAGEKVRALRGVDDGVLRIYTKAEAGPAWTRSSSSRAVFAVTGQAILLAIISAILALMIVMASATDPSAQSAVFVGVIIVGAVWVSSVIVLVRSVIAARRRRSAGLPAPLPNSDHL